jgi:2-methylisocitrate lyase-like PEP mutase family enzyme
VTDIAATRVRFRKLHDDFFTIPNAVSVGEARKLADLGFRAIASTSHGLSLALGKSDLSATLEETLANLWILVGATDLPVNADFESGFADDPAGVATSVKRAAVTGVAGLSIEDRKANALFDVPAAVERLRAASCPRFRRPQYCLGGPIRGVSHRRPPTRRPRSTGSRTMPRRGQTYSTLQGYQSRTRSGRL